VEELWLKRKAVDRRRSEFKVLVIKEVPTSKN